jgi:SAM-dependent methyltransferase
MPDIEVSRGGTHPLLRFIDISEQYGRHILEDFYAKIRVETACDLGAGYGFDLERLKKIHPEAKAYGIDFSDVLKDELSAKGIQLKVCNIEAEEFGFDDASLDLIIANQLLEHVKEIFWISDQIARSLKVGGHLIIGVPNITSLHNRLLFLLGKQPTQMKTHSAHVRGFAHNEIVSFFNTVWPGGFELVEKRGAQFYPFPKFLSRPLCALFPSLAFADFYLFKKAQEYGGEFLAYPKAAQLETNFFVGAYKQKD